MAKYILPFVEVNRGWYEIEADTIEQARELADNTEYVMDLEQFYDSGETNWDSEDLQEDITNG